MMLSINFFQTLAPSPFSLPPFLRQNHEQLARTKENLDWECKLYHSIISSFSSMAPRQIRCESCLVRPHNTHTGAAPYESLMVADVGDVSVNVFDIEANIGIIHKHVAGIINNGCKPLIMGGDHTITYPILKAIKVCQIFIRWYFKSDGMAEVLCVISFSSIFCILYRRNTALWDLFILMLTQIHLKLPLEKKSQTPRHSAWQLKKDYWTVNELS